MFAVLASSTLITMEKYPTATKAHVMTLMIAQTKWVDGQDGFYL